MMLRIVWLTVSALCFSSSPVDGFSSGPPVTVCTDSNQIPTGHNADAQNSASPYSIDLNGVTSYTSGTAVTVVITGSQNFKGFFVTARNSLNQIVGTMTSADGGHRQMCSTAALSHNSPDLKSQAMFTWTPDDSTIGTVTFRATVVQTQPVFWINVEAVIADASVESFTIADSSSSTAAPLPPTTPVVASSVTIEPTDIGNAGNDMSTPGRSTITIDSSEIDDVSAAPAMTSHLPSSWRLLACTLAVFATTSAHFAVA